MAAHTGQIITLDQMMNCPAPLQLGPDGKYPIPEPGIKKDREY